MARDPSRRFEMALLRQAVPVHVQEAESLDRSRYESFDSDSIEKEAIGEGGKKRKPS